MIGGQRPAQVDVLRQIGTQFDGWWTYVSWCAGSPASTPACKSFWTWTAIAAIAIGLFVLWKLLAWMIRPVLVWLEEMRWRARERKVADEDTMARYKVDDSKLYSGTSEENAEQRIRDALARKKVDDQQQRHHQKIDDERH